MEKLDSWGFLPADKSNNLINILIPKPHASPDEAVPYLFRSLSIFAVTHPYLPTEHKIRDR